MYNIELKPRAEAHLQKAMLWYNKQQTDLGGRFLDDLKNAFEALEINPFYAKRYKDVRGFLLNKFPFLILYIVNEKQLSISVLAVFHTSEDPKKYPEI